MIESLGNITLKNGEEVEASVIVGPDLDWAPRIGPLLQHKGDPWNWQVAQVLERDLDLESYFYVLHRGGVPFANIMTIEGAGVGVFGHVWTVPEDRRKGASSRLMALQMAHFADRGGRALFLGTGYDSVAYKMYRRFGFESVEPQSGYMSYYTGSEQAFNAEFFQAAPVDVEPLTWSHWPMMQPLFMDAWPGVVRLVAYGLNGQAIAEEEPLAMIQANERRERQGETPNTLVLRSRASQAIVGVASWTRHPLWESHCILDVYCHPDFWTSAPALIDALALPAGRAHHRLRGQHLSPEDRNADATRICAAGSAAELDPIDTARTATTDLIVLTK